jgi:hypothetical protein
LGVKRSVSRQSLPAAGRKKYFVATIKFIVSHSSRPFDLSWKKFNIQDEISRKL